jgi:hypothetical protein
MTLASSTLDDNPLYSMGTYDSYSHSHGERDKISRRALYHQCGPSLAHLSQRSAYNAYGRALHSLWDKALVHGYALAWHLITKDSTGKIEHDDWQEWAGPGRPAVTVKTYRGTTYRDKDKTPVLSVVLLSEEGWRIARQDTPNIGLCPRCLEYLASCN